MTAATGVARVHFVHQDDVGTEFRQYRAGELDLTYGVPASQFGWIRENLPGELHISPQLSIYYYGFNLTQPPFKDDPGLRRALSLVIDRERLTAAVTGLGEAPAYSWVPPGVANYTPQQFDYAAKPYEERVAEARELYRRSGYSSERAARGGDPLQLRRGPQPPRRGDRGDVEGRPRRRDHAVRGGIPGPAADHPGAQGHPGVPLELGRRLQRRLHLRPAAPEQLRHQPGRLLEPRLRRVARPGHAHRRPLAPPGAARGGGARSCSPTTRCCRSISTSTSTS